jgi:hypothetical protein
LIPFEDNYAYHNCSFFPDYAGGDPYPNTGIDPYSYPTYVVPTNATYTFDAYSFAAAGSTAPPPLQISDTNSQWIFSWDWYFADGLCCEDEIETNQGVYCGDNGTVCMSNATASCYGLPYLSLQTVITNSPEMQFGLLTPGGCVPGLNSATYTELYIAS